MRLVLRSPVGVTALAFAVLAAWSPSAKADMLSSSSSFPPAGGMYMQTNGPANFGFIAAIQFDNLHITSFQNIVVAQMGSNQIIDLDVSGSMTLVGLGPPSTEPVTGHLELLVQSRTGNATGTFATEMLQMNLTGSPVRLRESPTLPSAGQTSITPESGLFRIDSFFDVFTELSLDGGQTWQPELQGPNSPNGTTHLALQADTALPEPASLTLAGLGLIGIIGYAFRRKRST